MVRRRFHAWWVSLFFALGGACLSWPVWHAPWQAWQTHLDRQDQWDALAHSVRELKQTQQRQQEVSRDASSPADAADARDTSPPAWRAALQQMAQGTAHLVIQDLREQQGAITRHFESRLQQMNLTAARQQELYSAMAATQSAIAQSVNVLATAIQAQTAAIQDHRQVMQAHGNVMLDNSKRLDQLTQQVTRLAACGYCWR